MSLSVKYVYSIFLFLLMVVNVEAQPVKPFKHLGGPTNLQHVINSGEGQYAVLHNLASDDTVLTWFEHVTPNNQPDYVSASYADLVVWCYPQKYPHINHVLPQVSGKVVIYRKGELIFIGDKKWVDENTPQR